MATATGSCGSPAAPGAPDRARRYLAQPAQPAGKRLSLNTLIAIGGVTVGVAALDRGARRDERPAQRPARPDPGGQPAPAHPHLRLRAPASTTGASAASCDPASDPDVRRGGARGHHAVAASPRAATTPKAVNILGFDPDTGTHGGHLAAADDRPRRPRASRRPTRAVDGGLDPRVSGWPSGFGYPGGRRRHARSRPSRRR